MIAVSRPLDRALPDRGELPGGHRVLDDGTVAIGAFRREGDGWRARGRLTFAGLHPVRTARIEIEIAPWSAAVCEVVVRPVARRMSTWSPARSRRFHALAHATADVLAEALTVASGRMVCGATAAHDPPGSDWWATARTA